MTFVIRIAMAIVAITTGYVIPVIVLAVIILASTGESILLKGLSQVSELEISVDSNVVCFPIYLIQFIMIVLYFFMQVAICFYFLNPWN